MTHDLAGEERVAAGLLGDGQREAGGQLPPADRAAEAVDLRVAEAAEGEPLGRVVARQQGDRLAWPGNPLARAAGRQDEQRGRGGTRRRGAGAPPWPGRPSAGHRRRAGPGPRRPGRRAARRRRRTAGIARSPARPAPRPARPRPRPQARHDRPEVRRARPEAPLQLARRGDGERWPSASTTCWWGIRRSSLAVPYRTIAPSPWASSAISWASLVLPMPASAVTSASRVPLRAPRPELHAGGRSSSRAPDEGGPRAAAQPGRQRERLAGRPAGRLRAGGSAGPSGPGRGPHGPLGERAGLGGREIPSSRRSRSRSRA